ncbi:phosphopantetheine-binding protein [Thiotrichales bacterium 19X7-9]|nr:phosphopantetheine-binding protein [Thiotrichales bacterium 19X7-9]TNF68910.1 MAG: acyl carrier protein [Gammaproteobacteria bacterium]UTW42744.1 acyl carrier protein [bacterium SCSIO 12844]
MSEFEDEIKQMVIDVLNLEDLTPEDIQADQPLFGDDDNGLGLDSIDALELGVAIKKRYNITIDSDNEATKKHFENIHNLAVFILNNKAEVK